MGLATAIAKGAEVTGIVEGNAPDRWKLGRTVAAAFAVAAFVLGCAALAGASTNGGTIKNVPWATVTRVGFPGTVSMGLKRLVLPADHPTLGGLAIGYNDGECAKDLNMTDAEAWCRECHRGIEGLDGAIVTGTIFGFLAVLTSVQRRTPAQNSLGKRLFAVATMTATVASSASEAGAFREACILTTPADLSVDYGVAMSLTAAKIVLLILAVLLHAICPHDKDMLTCIGIPCAKCCGTSGSRWCPAADTQNTQI